MESHRVSFLEVENVRKDFGDYHALRDVSFAVEKGEVVTLLGPSGCGKTTMLRALAGLETIDRGRIALGGRELAHDGRVHLAAEKRGIGMVFQSYALWPHKTIFENIGLGLRLKKMPQADIAARVRWALDIVGLPGSESRFPSSLSGGQQQRISLARALALEPTCLLFDEPMSNLDVSLREKMRFEIRTIMNDAGITSVYVTHDHEEAMVVSDRIMIMQSGRIVQQGSPREIYLRPKSRFVAEFLGGANLFPLDVERSVPVEGQFVTTGGLMLRGSPVEALPPDPLVFFRAEALRHGSAEEEGATVLRATVESACFLGGAIQCGLRASGMAIAASLPVVPEVSVGEQIELVLSPQSVSVIADCH
ncbi:ABC transporter ATP-binding protein [Gluconacetobacter takamatsuzukensis]|uniref:ABC transporter ATP-binding protein n=1 Tax=Gluconacetobacter takamatsuzukensis TaxID=1286190 RepID=A0A7W4PPY2_9PROT|nr:ABC transporter ATP-binding protein [Gluconacetobacter takamatsuzukensis]